MGEFSFFEDGNFNVPNIFFLSRTAKHFRDKFAVSCFLARLDCSPSCRCKHWLEHAPDLDLHIEGAISIKQIYFRSKCPTVTVENLNHRTLIMSIACWGSGLMAEIGIPFTLECSDNVQPTQFKISREVNIRAVILFSCCIVTIWMYISSKAIDQRNSAAHLLWHIFYLYNAFERH